MSDEQFTLGTNEEVRVYEDMIASMLRSDYPERAQRSAENAVQLHRWAREQEALRPPPCPTCGQEIERC